MCGTVWQMPFKGIFWEVWSEDGKSVNRIILRYTLTYDIWTQNKYLQMDFLWCFCVVPFCLHYWFDTLWFICGLGPWLLDRLWWACAWHGTELCHPTWEQPAVEQWMWHLQSPCALPIMHKWCKAIRGYALKRVLMLPALDFCAFSHLSLDLSASWAFAHTNVPRIYQSLLVSCTFPIIPS